MGEANAGTEKGADSSMEAIYREASNSLASAVAGRALDFKRGGPKASRAAKATRANRAAGAPTASARISESVKRAAASRKTNL